MMGKKGETYKVQAPQDIGLDFGIETESVVTNGFDGRCLVVVS
jgi:hypothetical protein